MFGWITLQVATFAAVIWSEKDAAQYLGKEPDFVTASIMGVVAALFVTALVAAVKDLFMRYLSPSRRNAGTTFDPSAAIAHDSEASGESERLAARRDRCCRSSANGSWSTGTSR